MTPHLSSARTVELVAAVLLLVASVVLYRRRDPAAGGYGNQGAVILLVVAVIMGIHALGGLDYHPTKAEADAMRGRG
jgi:hypothetical protein